MKKDPLAPLNASIEAIIQKRGVPSLEENAPKGAGFVHEPLAPLPGRGPRARTVLVVEDNTDYRALVKVVLTTHAYSVVEASDGKSALNLVLRDPPDLLLVDFNMPRMNGYELLQEIRSRAELRKLPIVMLSGAPNREHIKSLGLDIVEFLDKPVTNGRLLETIARALKASDEAAEASAETQDVVILPPEESSAEPRESPPAAAERPQPETPPSPAVPFHPAADMEHLLVEEAPLDGASEAEAVAVESADDRKEDEVHGLEDLDQDSPLINQVNRILLRAVDMRASDIHVEPGESRVTVRVRVDGALRQLCTLPLSIHTRLTARIKIMANLTITERRLPQDGQFRAQIKGTKIEFRVSTLPCTRGEKIVLRILGQTLLKGDLPSLGLTPRDLSCLEKALGTPHGLILLTGPTGSGKTTTLYTMISRLNRPEVNILTAEDPVEYELANISQVRIRPTIGLTFESTLRAFLRQDPDIMLIGEIRDLETAEIAVKASITGHLVFSTLHTNSAPASIVRLTHMGVAPYLVAASVRLVVAQRLVRRLCPSCKVAGALREEDRRFLTPEEIEALPAAYSAAGCLSCNQTGYAGRLPVFEVMPVESQALRQLIVSHQAECLQEQAQSEGMTTLRQAALKVVAAGDTSMSEALKIVLGG